MKKFIFFITVFVFSMNMSGMQDNVEVVNQQDNSVQAFFRAIRLGNLERVKYFIENNIFDKNQKYSRGERPIHCACAYGKLNIVKYLVGLGVDVRKKDKEGVTPIERAFKDKHLHIVSYFICKLGYHFREKDFLRLYKPKEKESYCEKELKFMDYVFDFDFFDKEKKQELFYKSMKWMKTRAREENLCVAEDINLFISMLLKRKSYLVKETLIPAKKIKKFFSFGMAKPSYKYEENKEQVHTYCNLCDKVFQEGQKDLTIKNAIVNCFDVQEENYKKEFNENYKKEFYTYLLKDVLKRGYLLSETSVKIANRFRKLQVHSVFEKFLQDKKRKVAYDVVVFCQKPVKRNLNFLKDRREILQKQLLENIDQIKKIEEIKDRFIDIGQAKDLDEKIKILINKSEKIKNELKVISFKLDN